MRPKARRRARQLHDSLCPAQAVFSGLHRTLDSDREMVDWAEMTRNQAIFGSTSGRGGIRTPEAAQCRLTVFKTAAFNRSATLPRQAPCYALTCTLYTGLHRQGEVAEWL